MATENTPEDLGFARIYIEYLSRRGSSPNQRARAQILLGLLSMLDHRFPAWKEVLLAELAEKSETKAIADLFELPDDAEDDLFQAFVDSLLKKKGP